MASDIVRIHPADNVAVALADITKGETLLGVQLAEDIARGHKMSLVFIAAGEPVYKYGAPIGHATADIAPGKWVHTHNVKTNLKEQLEYSYAPRFAPLAPQPPGEFMGFARANGKVGVRNEIWVIPTVGCVNGTAQVIAQRAAAHIRGSISGVYAFTHPYGCSQLGDDHENTKKALAGLITHPNAGGVLVLGLGCENNGIAGLQPLLGQYDPDRIRFLNCQDAPDEIESGGQMVAELIVLAENDVRMPVPTDKLIVGLKCGGSDGLSGITANPMVGAFSDRIVAQGGAAILTEVPEMFGAETLLMARCESRVVFDKTVRLINNFKAYFTRHGQEIYENPSPGNKAGGITTLEDKSLGCTQKGGTAPVSDVLAYGEPLKTTGLNLLQAPGNDLVAATALAASGAHFVLFTTGRGTPFGAPVPTVKISSNTALYQKKPGWIDFNAGTIAEGEPIETAAARFYDYILQLASGETLANNEQNGIRDIAIFKDGVTS